MMTADAIDFIKKMRMDFVATVRPDGQSDLSHKGTLTVFDSQHLIFADSTCEIRQRNTAVMVEVANPFLKKGYRLRGQLTVIPADEKAARYIAFYEDWGMHHVQASVKNFVLIEIFFCEQVFSPSYTCGSTAAGKRKMTYENLWKF